MKPVLLVPGVPGKRTVTGIPHRSNCGVTRIEKTQRLDIAVVFVRRRAVNVRHPLAVDGSVVATDALKAFG
jgi:hypothetical protein